MKKYRVRVLTGPVEVEDAARWARSRGCESVLEGTESIYFDQQAKDEDDAMFKATTALAYPVRFIRVLFEVK